jgi:hypothetical protein
MNLLSEQAGFVGPAGELENHRLVDRGSVRLHDIHKIFPAPITAI